MKEEELGNTINVKRHLSSVISMYEITGQEDPVYTKPLRQITFYAADKSSYSQPLSILNPYDFQVKFKITLSDSSKYRITDDFGVSSSCGFIQPRHLATLTVHHVAVNSSNIGVTDKVYVQVYHSQKPRLSGKKELAIVLLDSAHRQGLHSLEDQFQNVESSTSAQRHLGQQPLPQPLVQEQRVSNKILYIIAIIIGVLILFMPKEGDFSAYFPSIFPRPTYEMKFMVCYLLGIASVLLFQS
ncbi:hypothetical protein CDAR_446271 [Caerostris darwini]|uniref:MSP domain-containing protein n=1 Tax=Caerostris darwini TaxID=1538125 RepID=A0AAV4S5D3_9ARAC|nr:hypothetical protein CDAR_446271 [Caerostris darwini]